MLFDLPNMNQLFTLAAICSSNALAFVGTLKLAAVPFQFLSSSLGRRDGANSDWGRYNADQCVATAADCLKPPHFESLCASLIFS